MRLGQRRTSLSISHPRFVSFTTYPKSKEDGLDGLNYLERLVHSEAGHGRTVDVGQFVIYLDACCTQIKARVRFVEVGYFCTH